MRLIFGTDGIRGKANTAPMTADAALRLGQAAGTVFKKRLGDERITAVIGKDTRRSGYMFECALTAGLCSVGVDVFLVGPMPTPAIAHLTKSFACDFGIVISASHNPAPDNGIKFFDNEGFKLPDDLEEEIEKVMEQGVDLSGIEGEKIGRAKRIDDAAGRYIEFTKNSIKNMSLEGLKVVLDCANGAAYKVAPMILRELGADVIVLNNSPDGMNINDECGSTHPEVLKAVVLGHKADIGIALDGDADRIMVVDEKGAEIDGDHLIAMCALDMKQRGKLTTNTVVVTIMTNLGFDVAMHKAGIDVLRAKVGDRYVVEQMRKGHHALGGEQSGHLIFFSRSTTGDGTLSALQVLSIMKKSGKRISELAKCMVSYPQVLRNVVVREKVPIAEMASVKDAIYDAEAKVGREGRVFVRYSGTEMTCRVMVEGKDEKEISLLADRIAQCLKKEIGG